MTIVPLNTSKLAETIENNVRSIIIKEHLNDPAFYDRMSTLLDEIIVALHAKAIEYEEYLKRIAELARRVEAVARPDGWRGVQAREMVIKRALYDVLRDVDE